MSADRRSSLAGALMVGMLLSGATTPAQARKKSKPRAKTVHTVAVIVTPRGKPNRQLLKAITTTLQTPVRKMPTVKIVSYKALQRQLKRNPLVALGKCGADLRCVSRLGRKVAARTVVIARVARRDDGGVTVGFVVVDVASMTIARRLSVDVTSIADVSDQLVITFAQALGDGGATTPVDSEVGDNEELALVALPLEPPPMDPQAPGLQPPSPRTRRHRADRAADGRPSLKATPLDDTFASEPALAALPLEIMPIDLGGEATLEEGERSNRPNIVLDQPLPILRYGGYGLAGLGIVGIAVGSFFGMQSTSLPAKVQYGRGGTTQTAIPQIQTSVDNATDMANIMFAAGASAAVIGTVLAALDLFVFAEEPPPRSSSVASLGVSGDSLGTSIGWSW